ncbi:MAG: universal stress protein [Saprospiraceae bacterium]
MPTFQSALIALDLSAMDDTLLSYTDSMARIFDTEKIYCSHVVPVPFQLLDVGTRMVEPAEEDKAIFQRVRERLTKEVEPYFKRLEPAIITTQIEVTAGRAYKKILQMAEEKAINLLVLGKKPVSENSGLDAHRVARRAKCAVLFVPQQPASTINQIIVPLDYSEYSLRALKAALAVKRQFKSTKITCVAVAEVLPPSYTMGNSYELIAARAKEQIKYTHGKFLEQHLLEDAELELVILDNTLLHTAEVILEYAHQQTTDLIIMGAKGNSPFENFLYGSVTERLVSMEKDFPVLVVR